MIRFAGLPQHRKCDSLSYWKDLEGNGKFEACAAACALVASAAAVRILTRLCSSITCMLIRSYRNGGSSYRSRCCVSRPGTKGISGWRPITDSRFNTDRSVLKIATAHFAVKPFCLLIPATQIAVFPVNTQCGHGSHGFDEFRDGYALIESSEVRAGKKNDILPSPFPSACFFL